LPRLLVDSIIIFTVICGRQSGPARAWTRSSVAHASTFKIKPDGSVEVVAMRLENVLGDMAGRLSDADEAVHKILVHIVQGKICNIKMNWASPLSFFPRALTNPTAPLAL
jgi:hypothetical protein